MQPSSDTGEHRVVDRPAQRALDVAEERERHLGGREPAIGPDAHVERTTGRRSHPDDDPEPVERFADDGRGVHRCLRDPDDGFHRVQDQIVDRVGRELEAGRRRFRHPRLLGWSADVGVRREVEQRRRDQHPGDPVGQRVVHLQQDRGSVALQSLEDVKLPERFAPVERTRQDPAHRALQLQPAPRRGDRRTPQVEVQIEMVVVDPERPGQTPRQVEDPLPEAWCEMQTRRRHLGDVLVRERTVRARGEHGDPRDVHVHGGTLQVEEARVEAGEPFGWHGGSTVPKC